MVKKEAPVITKKVRPYPFDAVLEAGSMKKPVEVLHIAVKGAIVRLNKSLVFVGEYYTMTFEFPVTKGAVSSQVRVLKTYDRVTAAGESHVERMAELHFQKLAPEHKHLIHSFLQTIRQEP